ncbi:hypothetical protein SARC_08801 [Sphaeroforma arctica JP610]|uniref:PABS domain-containing protein n=1 Tax=Sphaeroforma arctica JP610 TaxID=667725 RepID=A0A0L0FQG1_9EUKA|nr:hypothetical protein SARC_08801 [Sphaeroforma arctica JP610]KNC78786.1 hypothetical protein SARC_08801 [Sphaeroforma arctica JP610]|eukprot:XP_014152688.1 hypothetical protein SARC_08801 [Sphaeroforma arctica JP610]
MPSTLRNRGPTKPTTKKNSTPDTTSPDTKKATTFTPTSTVFATAIFQQICCGMNCGLVVTSGHRLIEPVYGNVFSSAADEALVLSGALAFIVCTLLHPYVIPPAWNEKIISFAIPMAAAWYAASLLKAKSLHSGINTGLVPTEIDPHAVARMAGMVILGTPVWLMSITAALNNSWTRSYAHALLYGFFGVGWALGNTIAAMFSLQAFGGVGSTIGMFGMDVCHATLATGATVIFIAFLLLVVDRAQRTANGRGVGKWERCMTVSLMMASQAGLVSSSLLSPFCSTHVPYNIAHGLTDSRYQLLDRTESNTGVIAIVNDTERGCVLMKADHSILGGTYGAFPHSSIFAVFHTHEAVRLAVQSDDTIAKEDQKQLRFLQIGLGVGVAAAAMQAHRCHVDVVEIDPTVGVYADKYFDYDMQYKPGQFYAQDAVAWLEERDTKLKYDMVLHDVFTGGSMPSALFTVEVFQLIRDSMTGRGVLGVNYFGHITGDKAADTRLVVATLLGVFEHVRTFSDEHPGDAHNLVFFASDVPIKFRTPVEADYLGSSIRARELSSLSEKEVTILPYQKLTQSKRKGTSKPFPIINKDNPLTALEKKFASGTYHFRAMREIFDVNDFWIEFM